MSSSLLQGQGDLSLANQRIHQSHAGMGVDSGESQRRGWRCWKEGHNSQDLPNCSGTVVFSLKAVLSRESLISLCQFWTNWSIVSPSFQLFSFERGPLPCTENLSSVWFVFCPQATYDPSHGYNPQPIDIAGMALSRELQVSIPLSFYSTERPFIYFKHLSEARGWNYLVIHPCSLWLSSWLRTITTPGAGRRNWSYRPKVRGFFDTSKMVVASLKSVEFKKISFFLSW